ncbi:hypothetical protein ACJMK2_011496 [Sinanodonta woodiana]|uniref:Ig-like domain-containing protein n=1 Tax=Sinanodonta woodiana TaxID=1069815 RepID=A0ABD3V7M2_SINWO
MCVAQNTVGEAKSSCTLSILECTSMDSVVPIFLRKPENRIADEGDKVVIDCDIIGSPQPTITWQKDTALLTEDAIFSASYDGRVAMLIIRNITAEHSGKYECVAENPMGKISADFLVVVKELKQPPSVSEPLCDVQVDCGKSIILECVIKGNPQPTVIWRMDRHLIQNRKDSNQSFEKGRAKLEIINACPTDSGCYECVARNSQGETSTSCHVIVKDAINMDRCHQQASPFQEGVSANDKRNTHFPASFEGDHKHSLSQVKSLATKVMLVRQSSLKSVDREGIKGSRIKRSESFKPESKQRSAETVNVENVKSNVPDLDQNKNIVQLDGMEHSRLGTGKEMDSTSLRMQKYKDANDNENGHVSKEVESGFSQPHKQSVGNEDARLDVRKVVEHGSLKQKYSDGNEHTKFDARKEREGDLSVMCKYSNGNEHSEFDVRKEIGGDSSVQCKYSDGNENPQVGGRKEMDSGSLRPRKYSWRSGIDNLSIDNKQASESSLAHSASNSDTRDITVNENEVNNCISESGKSTVLGFVSSSSNSSGSAIESKTELKPLSAERFSDKHHYVSAAVPVSEETSSPRRFIRRRSSSSDRLSARNSVDAKSTITDDQSIAGQRSNGTGTPLPNSTSQVNIRRSQSVKVSQTIETPSWVGMKLKRVEGGNVPRKEIDGSNLRKETKLNRSESARLVEKPSKNFVDANKCVQTKTESKKESTDSGREKIDIKPTEDNIPFTFKKRSFKSLTASSKETLETKEPFSVIAKAIDLSRSGSFKDNPSESRVIDNHGQSVPATGSRTPVKDVALDLTAQKFQVRLTFRWGFSRLDQSFFQSLTYCCKNKSPVQDSEQMFLLTEFD